MCSSSPSRASSSRSPLVLAIAYLSSESAVFHSRGNICSCPRSSRSRPLPPSDRAHTCGSRSASSRRRVELGRSHTTQPSSVRSSMGREPAPTIPLYRRAGSLLGRAAEAKGDSSSPLTSLRFEGTMQERTGPWRPPGSFTASPIRGSRRRVSRRPRSTRARSNRPESLPRVRVVVHAAACLRFELVKKCWHGGNRETEDGRDRDQGTRAARRSGSRSAPQRRSRPSRATCGSRSASWRRAG